MADDLRVTAHTYGAIEAILTAVYGRDVRQAIYDALRGMGSTLSDYVATINQHTQQINQHTQQIAEHTTQIGQHTQLLNDLGLSVVNGKLCVTYNA